MSCQGVCRKDGFGRFALDDFVSDAPTEDRRMVAVAQYHGLDVLRPPLVEQDGVIFRRFGRPPSIERFVDDQQSQVVASIEKGF